MMSILAVGTGCFLVWVVLKSIVVQLFEKDKESSLEGLPQKATEWLTDNGYEILKTKNEAKYVAYTGDQTISYRENAHFIARKNGSDYAVFVGWETPSDEDMCQRYFPLYVILDVKGLIFLNLTDESVRHVDFTVYRSRRFRVRQFLHRGMWFTGGLLVAISWLHRM
ncbi:hypothetical protein [Alicyclobacillus dauci]|uniref:DUF3592 domain-containing protein n=1 Tax=Alicyclobacillus dauci TaxID=1475485 RepID=A0ABY6Z859_9BACL|nr:hypothetical protein [Alicyclobacillus dauci]WAH39017.1 hypothetical protein NZD86_11305 [Alicyclobacillus dauci]